MVSKSTASASTPTSGTSTPPQSTGATSESATTEILQPSLLPTSQTTIYSAVASLVRRLASPDADVDLRTLEGHSFMTSLGFSATKDRDIFYSKTSKVYLVTTPAKLTRQCLGFLPTWGIELNGRYLTARTSAFPKTESECSLSDILEESVADKYFLSDKVAKRIFEKSRVASQTPNASTTLKAQPRASNR